MVALTAELLEKPEFQDQIKSIIENGDSSSLTAMKIRNELESHFGLEKDALKEKPFKKTIGRMIDKIFAELQQQDENESQEHTPEASASSREASPVKPSFLKRKAASSEKETEQVAAKKAKKDDDEEEHDKEEEEEEEEEIKASPKKRRAKAIAMDSDEEENDDEKEDEEMNDASDDGDQDEEEEEEEADSFTPPPTKKKDTKKPTKSKAPKKDDESVKRLKQFINKCGVRKVWAKELADCNSTAAETRKLKAILEELGVHGRPTLEKCETVKKERELKAELDSLDTSLIINETGRRTRTRNTTQSRPSYAVDDTNSEEEEEDEDDEQEGSADENNGQESGNESDAQANDDDNNENKELDEAKDEESSEDEFKGDDSDEDDA